MRVHEEVIGVVDDVNLEQWVVATLAEVPVGIADLVVGSDDDMCGD